jgi:hypothetical protein
MPQIVPIEKILLTPLGEAEADLAFIPDSNEIPGQFCCWILETGENWWFPQQLVRAVPSMSVSRRGASSPIGLSDALLTYYAKHIRRHKNSPFYEKVKALDDHV